MTTTLNEIRALLIDMDGVLWRGQQPLHGVADFFAFLNSRQLEFLLVTNNATRRAAHTVARLKAIGLEISAGQVLTSGDATARYLKRECPAINRLHIVGEQALKDEFTDAGYQIVAERADAVVVGLDRDLTYDKLKRATLELRAGARFIATNTDLTLPTEDGLVPGAGSIVAALIAASDAEPEVIGKPHRPMFTLALEILQTPTAQTAMLGDRLDTDIAGAISVGLPTILVMTGVSTRKDVEESSFKPDYVFDDLPELVRAWKNERE